MKTDQLKQPEELEWENGHLRRVASDLPLDKLILTEAAQTADTIELAKVYGRYDYRRITALLHHEGWSVHFKRVQQIWQEGGLKTPQKQPKTGPMMDGSSACSALLVNLPMRPRPSG